MTTTPIICFGQQPCGFFPRRFLFAKILAARRLQAELGGEIVFFYHDSDHDPRETTTLLRHRKTGEALRLNFAYENKWQRKFSPLFAKRIAAGWHDRTALQLPPFVDARWVEAFQKPPPPTPPIFAWRCTAAWACWKACAWSVRAIRPSAAPPATWRIFLWTCPMKAKWSAPAAPMAF